MPQTAGPDPRMTTVTTAEFTANFDALMNAVETQGVHVCITGDEYPVAVLMPWEHYRAARQGLAELELAYWRAWANPHAFDDAALRRTVADLVEDRPPTRPAPPRASAGDPAQSAGAADD